MTEKQKEFLKELDELMKKHDIECMQPKGLYIYFVGEDETIAVSSYEEGKFKHIIQTIHSYEP